MALHHSYTLLAPIYDRIVAAATQPMRERSLEQLSNVSDKKILICGVGTGLDIPYLPVGANYTGIDITPAMLKRARQRAAQQHVEIDLQKGNVMDLEFADEHFDVVLMHLILAVVATPEKALSEATRVLKPGGQIIVLDKFLRPGQRAPMRRLLNFFIRHIATRTDVVFEDLLPHSPNIRVLEDKPAFPGGWFRHIVLQKLA